MKDSEQNYDYEKMIIDSGETDSSSETVSTKEKTDRLNPSLLVNQPAAETTSPHSNPFNQKEWVQDPLVYAGFWMRFWAYLLDIIVIAGIRGLLIKPIFRLFDWPITGELFSAYNILSAVVFYIYFVLLTKFFGQTLGKMVFGLKVIPLKANKLTWPTVLFREWIGRYISASFLILYILAAFLPKKQALHDVFADTVVIHENMLLKEPVLSVK